MVVRADACIDVSYIPVSSVVGDVLLPTYQSLQMSHLVRAMHVPQKSLNRKCS